MTDVYKTTHIVKKVDQWNLFSDSGQAKEIFGRDTILCTLQCIFIVYCESSPSCIVIMMS